MLFCIFRSIDWSWLYTVVVITTARCTSVGTIHNIYNYRTCCMKFLQDRHYDNNIASWYLRILIMWICLFWLGISVLKICVNIWKNIKNLKPKCTRRRSIYYNIFEIVFYGHRFFCCCCCGFFFYFQKLIFVNTNVFIEIVFLVYLKFCSIVIVEILFYWHI